MEPTIWNIFALIFKLIIYLGFANVIALPVITNWAGFKSSVLRQIKYLLIKSSLLVMFATVGYFFIQVGMMSESGINGMFDSFMIQLVWNSSIGITTLYRLLAVGCILLTASFWNVHKVSFTYWLSLTFIGLSFCSSGHVSELSYLARFTIAIHVLIALWWMGSLYPLLLSCKHLTTKELWRLMHKFGQMAVFLVGTLIIAGVYLAFELIDSIDELTTTTYGQALSLKIILVFFIILLAAFHKFIIVPGLLKKKGSRNVLAASIKIEFSIGVGILVVTGILTTLLGPGHHS